MILGPQGELLAEPHVGGEGMVVAEIDIVSLQRTRANHPIVGFYTRFDVFRVTATISDLIVILIYFLLKEAFQFLSLFIVVFCFQAFNSVCIFF